jgi:hypothetical protein
MSFASLRRHAALPLMAAVLTIAPVSLAANAATAATAPTTATKATAPAVKKAVAKKKPHVSAKKAKRSPRAYAHKRVEGKYGWAHRQWNCLDRLWGRESGWRVRAGNSSGAYGIPQALPGHKMGRGWRSNGHAQVRWGLKYINDRYDTPCAADRHQRAKHWY